MERRWRKAVGWIGVMVVLALACSPAFLRPAQGQHQPDHHFDQLKRERGGWKAVGPDAQVDGNEAMVVRLALVQPPDGLARMREKLIRVSDPRSAEYGNHLKIEDITPFVALPPQYLQEIVGWTREVERRTREVERQTRDESRGCRSPFLEHSLSINRDYLFLNMSACLAGRMFGVALRRFRHPNHAKTIIRSAEEPKGIPNHVRKHIDYISGISDFPKSIRQRRASSVQNDWPGETITPIIIKKMYNINATGISSQSSQAVAEFEQAYFYPSDVPLFEKKFGLPIQPVAKIIGKNDPSSGYLGEASLDVEYIIGVGTQIPTWVFSFDLFDLVNWAINVSSTPNAPKVHSISWGSGESGYDPTEMRRVDTEFQKLGLLGMSVFAASGDQGTGHTGTFWCGSFDPTFPASAPHVTAVGGTYLDQSTQREIAVSFSGGGFSNVFPTPDYQQATISAYLNNPNSNLPPSEYWNQSGRAIPDVSAISTNFVVVIAAYDGGTMSGTSAATPTFAAIISLINDARYQRNKKPLGFLNPLLYQLRKVGYDVIQGNNKDWYCDAGFQAVAGWDAITGLGTPNYSLLLNALLNV